MAVEGRGSPAGREGTGTAECCKGTCRAQHRVSAE